MVSTPPHRQPCARAQRAMHTSARGKAPRNGPLILTMASIAGVIQVERPARTLRILVCSGVSGQENIDGSVCPARDGVGDRRGIQGRRFAGVENRAKMGGRVSGGVD